MTKNDIYPSVPLKDVGKRKRNDARIDTESQETVQPSKKYKAETSTGGSYRENNKEKPSTIVSTNQNQNDNDNHSSNSSSSEKVANININKQVDKSNSNRNNKKWKKMKRNGGDKVKVGQSSNKPVAFDYSQVDFKKFQGGSKKNPNKNEVETKFHGKVS